MAGNRFAPDLRMRKLRNRRPGHATVVAYLALFVALSGTAMAVDGPLAGQNTVGSEDIINSEGIQGIDVKNTTLAGAHVANNSLPGADLTDNSVTSAKIADSSDRQLHLARRHHVQDRGVMSGHRPR